jgi:hypothetical protein
MREIKRIAQGLLDEMKIMRERYGDRSEIAGKIRSLSGEWSVAIEHIRTSGIRILPICRAPNP